MPILPEFQAALTTIVRPIRAADLPTSLDDMRNWLSALGLTPPPFPVIVVAGSVGKGSMALALARRLSENGWRIGLYTSPHLHSFRERFQVDGEMISQQAFVFHVERVIAATQTGKLQSSTFEAATLIAFDWFVAQGIDLAICEIGMGGRFDAVNAIPNQLAVLTLVEMEHAAALGGTLESIAWHKAGILQPHGIGVSLAQSPSVKAVFENEAAAVHTELLWAADEAEILEQASEIIRDKLPSKNLVSMPKWATQLPGRLEVVQNNDRTFIIDGAHTALGAKRLREFINTFGQQPILLIAALLQDKPAAGILSHFNDARFRIVLAPLPGQRSAQPADILSQWQPQQATVEIATSIEDAFKRVDHTEQLIVICGSLRTVALAREWLGLLSEEELEESVWTRALFASDSYSQRIR